MRRLAPLLLLCLWSCGTPPVAPDECVSAVREGDVIEFVAVGHDFEDFCPAGFDAAEDHARWVAEAWGGDAAESIEYRLFESREHPCWPCGSHAACGYSGGLRSTVLPHRHELAHAARSTNCSSLLEEGWAMLYGDYDEFGDTTGDLRAAIASVEADGRVSFEYYGLAMRFVAYVIEIHGNEALRGLCAVPTNSQGEFEQAMNDVLGLSFDAVLAEFNDYSEWSAGELRQDRACETESASFTIPASWTLSMDCSSDRVEGKLGSSLSTHTLVEVSEYGLYEFEVDANQDVDMEIRNCQRDGLGSIYYAESELHPTPGAPATYDHLLPPGVYVVRVTIGDVMSSGAEVSINATMQPLP